MKPNEPNPADLQVRYEKRRAEGEEPVYVAREDLTDEDVLWNIDKLEKSGRARMAHADALEAWAQAVLVPTIVDNVRKEADVRSIENCKFDQCELFGDEFLDAIVNIDAHSIMKVRGATLKLLWDVDRRKYENVRIANDSYAKWRERYDKLLDEGGMLADPTLIVENAVKRINRD